MKIAEVSDTKPETGKAEWQTFNPNGVDLVDILDTRGLQESQAPFTPARITLPLLEVTVFSKSSARLWLVFIISLMMLLSNFEPVFNQFNILSATSKSQATTANLHRTSRISHLRTPTSYLQFVLLSRKETS